MAGMEELLTLLFNALLLVFVVKLLLALFNTKIIVILLYILVLLFAMLLSGRFPGSRKWGKKRRKKRKRNAAAAAAHGRAQGKERLFLSAPSKPKPRTGREAETLLPVSPTLRARLYCPSVAQHSHRIRYEY
ncbi:unnamed protein product [Miscanthus lutarioriparius]|uniref:Uncharacterized protein n=1 Tax=Miscanthus lutarioriparius TaxID=422564 RepID=A0A811RHT2_9POAL|nr:unnamed protein product [Miscanthus lutarioriparius]